MVTDPMGMLKTIGVNKFCLSAVGEHIQYSKKYVGSLNSVIAEVGCHICSLYFVGLLCRCSLLVLQKLSILIVAVS